MNYDITFCSNKDCGQKCKRNQNNIQRDNRPVFISVSNFEECEYFELRGGTDEK